MSFPRKSYRLTSDAEKSRVTGKGWQGGVCVCVFFVLGKEKEGKMQQGPRSPETWAF